MPPSCCSAAGAPTRGAIGWAAPRRSGRSGWAPRCSPTCSAADGDDRTIHQTLFSWIPVNQLQVDFGLQIDQLSICFVLLISGVGSLIHIYSVAYMAEDTDRRRFFGYLNLFLASMLLLVVADNYLVLYVGWEGVGLASYLLIGFWYHKPSAATAAKKAFVMNRVGDAGPAVGMFVMFSNFGTLSYAGVFAAAPGADQGALTAMGLLLLMGACAKSAQVPLQAWLGDAMEGPTPVSALIHAATMVTAGVYLIVRSNPLFNLAPDARLGVVIVGAVTLLFGAFIGCAKDDIKRALAASTMSQIGYMVLAAGLGPAGYAFAIMHLLTHGFFKAGLFLGSGSIIHAMHEEQNMRRYGGLRKALPITFVTFGLGYLAIIGVWPFAGFFSKDAIIEAALGSGGTQGYVLGGAALLGAGITAFYMTRVMLMTFFGEKRWAPGTPSARGAGADDLADDPAGLRLGVLRLPVHLRRHPAALARARRRSSLEEARPCRSRPGSVSAVALAVVAVGIAGGLPDVRRQGGNPERGPGPGLGADDGGTRRPVRRCLQRGGVHAPWRRTDRRAGRSRQRRCGRLGQRAGSAGEPDLESAAGDGNRLRPQLRAVHAGRCGPGGRGDPGGEAVVNSHLPWLSVLWLVPLAGSLLIILLPPGQRQLAKWTGLVASVLTLAVAIVVTVGFDKHGATYQFVESHQWIPAFGAGYTLGVDGIAVILVLLTAVLIPLLLVAGWNDGGERDNRGVQAYVALTLAIESMVLISVIALDVLLFYVFFEAMLIPMYFLIGGFGRGAGRSRAAVKFLLYNLFGGLIMLAAVIGLYVVTAQHGSGTFDFREIVTGIATGRFAGVDPAVFKALFLGFMFAFAIKAPLWPLHRWLPDAVRRGHAGDRGVDHRGDGQGRHLRHAALLPAAVSRAPQRISGR